jgi:hypothetical protein
MGKRTHPPPEPINRRELKVYEEVSGGTTALMSLSQLRRQADAN